MQRIRRATGALGVLGLVLGAALGSSGASAQVDATYRIVAHYDTVPAGQAAPAGTSGTAADVFKAYASRSLLETGAVSVKVLASPDRPSRVELLEVWSTKAAYTAHQGASAYTTLKTAIAPWLVGPVEEIPHTHFK